MTKNEPESTMTTFSKINQFFSVGIDHNPLFWSETSFSSQNRPNPLFSAKINQNQSPGQHPVFPAKINEDQFFGQNRPKPVALGEIPGGKQKN